MNNKQIKKVVIIFTVICVLATIINVAFIFILPMYLSYKWNTDLSEAKTIGIIGGADGPTTIFVGNLQFSHLITVIFTMLSIIGIMYLIISKRKKENRDSDN